MALFIDAPPSSTVVNATITNTTQSSPSVLPPPSSGAISSTTEEEENNYSPSTPPNRATINQNFFTINLSALTAPPPEEEFEEEVENSIKSISYDDVKNGYNPLSLAANKNNVVASTTRINELNAVIKDIKKTTKTVGGAVENLISDSKKSIQSTEKEIKKLSDDLKKVIDDKKDKDKTAEKQYKKDSQEYRNGMAAAATLAQAQLKAEREANVKTFLLSEQKAELKLDLENKKEKKEELEKDLKQFKKEQQEKLTAEREERNKILKERQTEAWTNIKEQHTIDDNEKERKELRKATDDLLGWITGDNEPEGGWDKARVVAQMFGIGSVVDTIQDLASGEAWVAKGTKIADMFMNSFNDGSEPYKGRTVNSADIKFWSWTNPFMLRYDAAFEPADYWKKLHTKKTFNATNFGLTQITLKGGDGLNYWLPTEDRPKGRLLDPVIRAKRFYTGRTVTSAANKRLGPITAGDGKQKDDTEWVMGHIMKPYNQQVDNAVQMMDGSSWGAPLASSKGALDIATRKLMPKSLKDAAASSVKVTQSDKYPKQYSTEAIHRLLEAGPDAFSNQFDVFLCYEKAGEEVLPKKKDYNVIEKNLLNGSVFATRVASIEIPQISRTSGNTNFLMRTIPRKSSVVSQSMESSFVMEADENLYYIDYFQGLAGRNTKIKLGDADKSEYSQVLEALRKEKDMQDVKPIVLLNELSKMWHHKTSGGEYNLNKRHLCIFVKETFVNPLSSPYYFKGRDYTFTPFWVFENVKFLGTDTAIDFNQETADRQQFTIKFIYRRLYRTNSFPLANGANPKFGEVSTEDAQDKSKILMAVDIDDNVRNLIK